MTDARISGLGLRARQVVAQRYAQRYPQGQPIEDWDAVCRRVVAHVAQAERPGTPRERFAAAALAALRARELMPNTPCLISAGTALPQLASCFVLDVPDSVAGVMRTATDVATIQKQGGGTGFSFDRLRPAGAAISGIAGRASGPVSFISLFDGVTDVIKRGGLGRGANMAVLRIDHPDALRFIDVKADPQALLNFNLSLALSDEFMSAASNGAWLATRFEGRPWSQPVRDPRTGADYVSACAGSPPRPGMVFAPDLWQRIVDAAHAHGEPGVIFIDQVNRGNRLRDSCGDLRACNPCAEQFLHPYSACNLASIDLSRFVDAALRDIDWPRLAQTVHLGIRWLDNVIDTCAWPLPEIEAMVRQTRPIGLGLMGFADTCLALGVRYGSGPSVMLMERITAFTRRHAWTASAFIGGEKGPFPDYRANRDAYGALLRDELRLPLDVPLAPRNHQTCMFEPSATVAMVAETSSGIEPNFAFALRRSDFIGSRAMVHPLAARSLGIAFDPDDEDSITRAADWVSRRAHELPAHFVDALQVSASEHLQVAAAAQAHVDNGVSKTCNGPASDSAESVGRLYRLAHRLGCKSMSYYREGSRSAQVLSAIAAPPQGGGGPSCPQC